MTRQRIALIRLVFGLVLLPIGEARAQELSLEDARARSVLFYLVDTCRDDRLSFNGYDRETTAFLAWLAERSVVFDACYSQAPQRV